jgi:hypothetical protein
MYCNPWKYILIILITVELLLFLKMRFKINNFKFQIMNN